MNKKLLISALLCFFVLFPFMSLNAQWARTYGGNNKESVHSIQQTSDGGYIVAGYTQSFGAGKNDFWVLKLDSNGNIKWQFTYGSEDSERAYSIQQTSDGGYIVAGCTDYRGFGETTSWVLKLDSAGDIEWQHSYGGKRHSIAYSTQQTIDGGYIVAGVYRFMGTFSKFEVFKLSSAGDVEWWRTYKIADIGSGMSCSILQTIDGGYILAGFSDLYRVGWVLKFSSTGDIEWQRTYGTTSRFGDSKILQTTDGGYIVGGWSYYFDERSDDLLILKLSSTGDIEWQRSYGGSGDDRASSIQQTSDGGYIVAGSTKSFGAGDYDILVLKLDSVGDIEWERVYGGSNYDSTFSIQQTSDGGYIVAGSTKSFGAGDYDILVLKLDSAGDIVPTCELIGSSNVTISNTYISPQDTYISLQDINMSSHDTSFTLGESNAIITTVCGEPVDDAEDSEENKGGCFIATAAYGSLLHSYVRILRDFRDKYLMPSKLGRALVDIYYKYSPFIAELIIKNKALKVVVRVSLFPLVAFSYSMLHFGWVITAAMLALISTAPTFLILFSRRRFRQTRA